jgi:hypothetical protein
MLEHNQNVTNLAPSQVSPTGDAWVPQFTAAEYGKRASKRCDLCSDYLFSECFKVNGQKICATCADQIRAGISTASLGSLSGALAMGVVGTLLGMLFYSAITQATGWTIGYFALFVGWIVGRAVIAGARGIGSTRIQFVASLLTYVAISVSSLPAFVYEAYRRGIVSEDLRVLLREVILPGLASPFVRLNRDPVNGGIHFFIIFLGMCVAWRLTRVQPLTVGGPFPLKA